MNYVNLCKSYVTNAGKLPYIFVLLKNEMELSSEPLFYNELQSQKIIT